MAPQEQLQTHRSGVVESEKSLASLEAEKNTLIAGVIEYEEAEINKLNENYFLHFNKLNKLDEHNKSSEKYQLEKTFESKINKIKNDCKDKITEINENYQKRIEQLNG